MSAFDTPETTPRHVIWIEDALVLASLLLIWLPMFGFRGLWVNLVLLCVLAVMAAVLVRRKRRFDRLMEEMRRREEEMAAAGMPFIPGVPLPPDRMGAADPRDTVTAHANGARHDE